MGMIERSKRSGKRFLNPVPSTVGGFSLFFKVLWRFLTDGGERIPKRKLGPFRTDARVYETAPASGLRVTWMGHSSTLLEIVVRTEVPAQAEVDHRRHAERVGAIEDEPRARRDVGVGDALRASRG